MEFLITNNLAEIEPVVEKMGEFCKKHSISDEAFYDFRLALDEAVSNTIKYGYGDSDIHRIRITLALLDNMLSLEIEDDARAFDPLTVATPDLTMPVEQKSSGGLGIYLLRALMDSVEYKRIENKNILLMKKSILPSTA